MTKNVDRESVMLDRRGNTAILKLNRPHAMNAFTTEMAIRFNEAMKELESDRQVRAIVITGTGTRAFCVGADLKERDGMSSEQWRQQHQVFEEKNRRVRECQKPVIAAVNGYAIGGGLELAMQADFFFASKTAQFGLPEVKRGIIPGGGGTQWLPRRVPLGVAMEMLLTGATLTADEALEIGLVNGVFPPDDLLDKTMERALAVASNSPAAVRQIRKSVRLGSAVSITRALGIELECYGRMVDHPDRAEGVAAFVEKRAPTFLDAT